MRDVKSDFIFTLNEFTKDEKEEALRQKFRKKGSEDLKMKLKYNEDLMKSLNSTEREEIEQSYIN